MIGQEQAERPAALQDSISTGGDSGPRPMALARPAPSDELEDILLSIAPIYLLALLLLFAVSRAVVVALTQPAWLTSLSASLGGTEPKAYWYLSRASGLVAFGLLWASMALGLAITNKLARAWPG